MARILSIDYGGKRTGIAVTDPLQIIATGLTTVDSRELIPFLKKYFAREEVELMIIGEPKNWDESDTHATPLVKQAVIKLQKEFPQIPIKMVDERYTSKLASQAMVQMGLKKKDRQNKRIKDEVAATILLQEYLASDQGTHPPAPLSPLTQRGDRQNVITFSRSPSQHEVERGGARG